MKRQLFYLLLVTTFFLNISNSLFAQIEAKSGKTAYGFCIYADNWGSTKPFGLYSFNTATPSTITRLWNTTLSVDAAVYYDGYYYAQSSVYSGVTYLSMEFGKFNATTGAYTKIVDWSSSLPKFIDFTIDYTTNPPTLIGLKTISVGTWRLCTVNLQTGQFANLASSNTVGAFYGIACNFEGTVFAVNWWSSDGELGTINKSTGDLTSIGNLNTLPKFLQSMEFDRTDGVLYWAQTTNTELGRFGTINPATGQYTNIGTIGQNAEIVGLHVPLDIGLTGTPSAPTEFTAVAAAAGVKTATLNWKTPTLDNVGAALSTVSAIKLYRNNVLINTVTNPTVGALGNYVDNVTANGNYFYKVTAENSNGVSIVAQARAYIGEDVPTAATNVVLTRNGTQGVLNWTAPTTGVNGGWINPVNIRYKIIRIKDFNVEAEVTTNLAATTFTDNTVTVQQSYRYRIEASSNAGAGKKATSNPCFIGNPFSLPYSCMFTETQWLQWTWIDANNDGTSWRYYNDDNDVVHYSYNRETPGDDWLISPPINLVPGSYKLSFDYRAKNMQKFENMKVFFGQGETAAAQSNLLATIENFNNTLYNSRTEVITVTSAGAYNFSFYVYSIADQFGIQISNIKLVAMDPNDLESRQVKGHFMPTVNLPQTYTVFVRNSGSAAQNNYTVQLIDAVNTVLATTTINTTIAVNETKPISLSWTPTTTGIKQLRGKVILSGDQNISNDISKPIEIEVQATGFELQYIDEGDFETSGFPYDFTWYTSTQQSIYLHSELGMNGGKITKIAYPYRNLADAGFENPKQLRLFLANTELATLDAGWIPKSEFTKVFDANVQVLSGEGYIILTLTQPFIYSGENLCIMTEYALNATRFFDLKFKIKFEETNRSLTYGSYTQEFNGTQSGTLRMMIPNVVLQFDTQGAGAMNGIVKCSGVPVEGVKITISPLGFVTTTNEQGEYNFGFVPIGTYSIQTSKHGYINNTTPGIMVVQNITTTTDINIQLLPTYTVTGKVQDVDGNNLPNVMITVTGYQPYSTTTNATGNFSIPNVYRANNYSLRAKSMGLDPAFRTFNVTTSNLDLGTIVLKDIVKVPLDVQAKEVANNAEITWKAPPLTKTFRYDNGTPSGYRGFLTGTAKSIVGSCHRVAAKLESMSWYTAGDPMFGGPHPTVNVFVFDLNASGNPTPTILFSQMNVPNTDDQWSTFTFPTLLNCPNGFLIAISFVGYVGIGRDSGLDPAWPYVAGTSYYCGDYDEEMFIYEAGNRRYSYMMRAEGFDVSKGEITQVPHRRTFSHSPTTESNLEMNDLLEIRNIEMPIYDVKSSEKSIKGYKVWRLVEGDEQNEASWTSLTPTQVATTNFVDVQWNSLASNPYKYAVKTVYTNETSNASFSNMLPKNMYNNVTINVSTNTGQSAQGAYVKLTHNDNNTAHIYNGTVNSQGKVTIPNIWKGNYKVNIYLADFNVFEQTNVAMMDGTLEFTYQLTEMLIKPTNLQIFPAGADALFTWDFMETVNITDGAEQHQDFTINSKNPNNWSYIDADKGGTFSIEGCLFPNQEMEMAYIIFNPFQTTPPMEGFDEYKPHSGQKYFGCFSSYDNTPNQDYIISTELFFKSNFTFSFWAKSLVSEYGLERFRVGYSTTGKNESDFDTWVTTGNYVQAPTTWTKYSYHIPKEARYVTIKCVSNLAWLLMIDDIFIGIEGGKTFQEFEIFLNGNPVTTTTEKLYRYTNLFGGNYTASVRAKYTSGVSEVASIPFSIVGIAENETQTLKVFPNPVSNILTIEGDYSSAELFDEFGKLILKLNGETQIDCSSLATGVYFLKAFVQNNSEVYKIVKQ